MLNPWCFRCRVRVTLPSGQVYDGFFVASMVKSKNGETAEQSIARQFRQYHEILCGRLGGPCKVKIVEPCQLAQECG